MLTKIREKSQGAFAWGILIAICVPFAFWGINNYFDNGREAPIASVGDKDFYQRDVNRAYEQFSQSLKGMGIDEQTLKTQALQKLIKDEALLQYVHKQGLVVTDNQVRDYIKGLEYFQTEGKFDDGKYKILLNSQHISSAEFVNRVRNAMLMEQFQHVITESSFSTQYDLDSFFKIQNQERDIQFIAVPTQTVTTPPSDAEISAYFQQHQSDYQSPEQVSVEYVELSEADLASKAEVTEEKLKAFYEEQKDQYSTPERRKISHILFAVNDKTDAKAALAKAQQAKQALAGKDFVSLAKELSDDKGSGKDGGDLGLFTPGVMEKSFDEVAGKLKLDEVSEPVQTPFGYHLIKVTELVPGVVKPFADVKDEVTKAYQKSQVDTAFYEAGEKLTEVSYENPDSLQAVANALKLTINKTPLFTKDKGEGVAADDKVREMAFSEEVLKGNNSTPIELAADKLVVLRLLEHKPAQAQELAAVKQAVADELTKNKAQALTEEKAQKIKERLQAGEVIGTVAAEYQLQVKEAKQLMRRKSDQPEALTQAVFKAAKPVAGKPSVFITPLPGGEQVVVNLLSVKDGVITESDKKQLGLARIGIANAIGQVEFNDVIDSIQSGVDITINATRAKPTGE
ncbi:peptidylprolyl isomerase [Methylosoma difficile]